MSRKVIELVQVLVDRIHQGGYTQRALEDDIYAENQKRIAAEKDRDHWKQARQEAHEAGELMRAEIETLQGAMAADDQRLRDAEERVWPGVTWGCDAPDKMAEEILHLRKQLAEQQAETVDVRRQRNNETDRLNATNAVSVQQRDEIAYLRARLDEERSVIAGLRKELADAQRAVSDAFAEVNSVREQLAAANAAVTLQRAGIERQSVCIGKVRAAQNNYQWPASWIEITAALAELDGEPTPVAEPLDAEGGA